VAAVGDPELLTHHVGSVLTARYSQHVSSLLQEALRGRSPTPLPIGVRRPGEGPELHHQGHSEGQLRASLEERQPQDTHQGAER
jgi:hypothetical protein